MTVRKLTKDHNIPHQESIKDQLLEMVLDALMDLPAYRLKGKYKDTFEKYCYLELHKRTLSHSIKKTTERNGNDITPFLPISELYKQPNSLEKWIFSIESLPDHDKNTGWITLIFFGCAFLIKVDNPWLQLLGGLSLFVSYFSFLILSFRFFFWHKQNIDLTFSIINGILRNIYEYTNYVDNINQKNVFDKASMISESLIEDEIASLDYRQKKVNLFHMLFSFFCCIVITIFLGDMLIIFIKNAANVLTIADYEIIKKLNKENFSLLFLFPIGVALSRDILASALQERHLLLRQSLAILKSHIEDRKLSILNEDSTCIASEKRRSPPESIAGKGKTLGDIVSPIVSEEDWECLK